MSQEQRKKGGGWRSGKKTTERKVGFSHLQGDSAVQKGGSRETLDKSQSEDEELVETNNRKTPEKKKNTIQRLLRRRGNSRRVSNTRLSKEIVGGSREHLGGRSSSKESNFIVSKGRGSKEYVIAQDKYAPKRGKAITRASKTDPAKKRTSRRAANNRRASTSGPPVVVCTPNQGCVAVQGGTRASAPMAPTPPAVMLPLPIVAAAPSPVLVVPQNDSGNEAHDATASVVQGTSNKSKRRYMKEDDVVELSDKEVAKPDKGNETEQEVEKLLDLRHRTVQRFCKNGIRGLIKDFAMLKKERPPDELCTAFKRFEARNRHEDVYCLDSSRVILKNREEDDDYIHASFGPTDETVGDFWHMVTVEELNVIVMLCQFVEQDDEKCAEYFPQDLGKEMNVGEYVLKTETEEKLGSNIIRRTILVKRYDDSQPRHITHFFWGDWPDHLAPLDPDPVLSLIKLAREKAAGKPILVHCSAGIGRTGTFVAIEMINERLKEASPTLTVIDLCKELRQQRAHAVQSLVQYLYLHVCLVKLAITENVVRADDDSISHFMADYNKYMTKLMKRRK